MSRLKAFGFLLAFLTPALMPWSAWLARNTAHPDLAAWFPLFFLFVLLPLADYAIGRDADNPDADLAEQLDSGHWFRSLTLICVPVQLVLVYWSCGQFQLLPLAWSGKLGWLLSQGVVSGVLAINVAHELIHKSSRFEPWAGGLLLCSVNYVGFKVEHVRGHHVHVSTPADASSARFNEAVYPFVLRALFRNTGNAWRLEAERLRKLGLSAWHWQNELIGWTLLTLAFALIAGIAWGPLGMAFFLAQGLTAATTLEIINYIEHYGLQRRRLDGGRYERTTHLHSWNSNYLLTNLMLFQLQRHSDHHETARRRYQALRHYEESPQLPGGYAAMFLLALLPPLWKRLINPRVLAFRSHQAALLQADFRCPPDADQGLQ